MLKASPFCKLICIYIVIMILGMAISNYFQIINVQTTFWLFNLAGFSLFCFGYFFMIKETKLICILLSFLFFMVSLTSICINSIHLFDDFKSIGLNINLFVVSISIILICNSSNRKLLNDYDVIIIYRLILLIGVISTIYNIIFGNISFEAMNNTNNVYTVSTRSFFDHKNTYGIYSFFSVISGIYLILRDKHKFFCLGLTVLQLFSLIISLCRSALLISFIFLLLFLFISLGKKELFSNSERKVFKIGLFLVIFVGVTLLSAYLSISSFKNFVDKAIIRQDFGDAGRSGIWESGVGLLDVDNMADLFFGIGWAELYAGGNSYLHNVYLELFVVGGIFKLVFYFFILLSGIKINLKNKHRKGSIINIFGFTMAISYIAFAFFESQIILELGITPFMFILFIYIIPQNYDYDHNSTNYYYDNSLFIQ